MQSLTWFYKESLLHIVSIPDGEEGMALDRKLGRDSLDCQSEGVITRLSVEVPLTRNQQQASCDLRPSHAL